MAKDMVKVLANIVIKYNAAVALLGKPVVPLLLFLQNMKMTIS